MVAGLNATTTRQEARMTDPTVAAVLFQSTDDRRVLDDPVNQPWLAVVREIDGDLYAVLARRYYLALYAFRRQPSRPGLPNEIAIEADGKEEADGKILQFVLGRKDVPETPAAVFADPRPAPAPDLPPALADLSVRPPLLRDLLGGRGRPPADALCLLRASAGAVALLGRDDPTSVFELLRSNPTFARACGFLGPRATKEPGELTSRRLPSLSTCEQFDEVMTRYGLWHEARLDQVRANVRSGAVVVEDTVAFDTTHIEAASGCGSASLTSRGKDGRPKERKVPRLRKRCSCGKDAWQGCPHPWSPTDPGAAVVVKGPTRIFWAHKASIAGFGGSEIPFDARVLEYAATHDGKTLAPHIELLGEDLPETVEGLRHALADGRYEGKQEQVDVVRDGTLVHVPVHARKSDPSLAAAHSGIDRFTPAGVPVCEAGRAFDMLGRDLEHERYIWTAPDGSDGRPVCAGCPFASTCLRGQGARRHVRTHRKDFPQIDWEHPQHLARNKARYAQRTGIERGIKRLKVDLGGERLTHRNAVRAQAHLDRRLLALHLMLAAARRDTT